MKTRFLIIFLFCIVRTFSQDQKFVSHDLSINSYIDGTLLTPKNSEKPNLVIIIGGSGPTDRNGNQNFMRNNSLKKLAEGLSSNNIATYRYDKRIVKQLKQGNIDKNIMFDDFVTDASSTIEYLKKTNSFNKIYVLGHSQGSLVGMLAAQNKANGFISIAGVGQSIDSIVIEQIEKTYPLFVNDAKRIFKTLRKGKRTDDYPQELATIFSKDIQSFMMNWMQYNPVDEIKRLEIPILIIAGTNDLQVDVKEAIRLKEAVPSASLKIIDKMNHVLVPIQGDNLENSKSYDEENRKLSKELINSIVDFIKKEDN